MKVIHNFTHDATWGLVPYFQQNLNKLSDESTDEVLFNGAYYIYDKSFMDLYKNYKRRCLLAHWTPCELLGKQNYFHLDMYEFFTEVYCVCPYTCNVFLIDKTCF